MPSMRGGISWLSISSGNYRRTHHHTTTALDWSPLGHLPSPSHPAKVVDAVIGRQWRDLIRGGPGVPLSCERLGQLRFPGGQVVHLGSIAFHVVKFPGVPA